MTRIMALMAMLVMLNGCAAVAIQGASRAKDQAVIATHESAAEAGDATAQYEVGKAHCCTIAGAVGMLNNQTATHWFCLAAAQDNANAQYELGRIYSGDLVRGMNGPAKVAALLTTQAENKPLALMWFNLAAANGHSEAADKAKDIRDDMTPREIADAMLRAKSPGAQPCEWNAVYPDHQI